MAYSFPNATTELPNLKRVKEKIIIWGTGKIAKLTLKNLTNRGIETFAFCDNDAEKQGKIIDGKVVLRPSDLQGLDVIVFIASRYNDAIEKQLEDMGIKKYIKAAMLFAGETITNDIWLNNMHALTKMKQQIITENFQDDNALLLESIDVVVTEKCSLKCRDCANLMQYFEKPEHEDIEVVRKALDNLMQAVDFVFEIRILGGEPFMNKDMHKYIAILEKYNNYGDIIVYTNGTIVPKDENLKCLKKDNVFLSISNYGNVSAKLNEIVDVAKKENILYEVKEIDTWQNCGRIKDYRRSVENLKQVYKECCCNKTLSLRHGKIFGCPFSGNADVLKAIPKFKEDCVDVINLENASEIRESVSQLLKKDYYMACNYCGGRPLYGTEIEPAIQTETVLDWKNEE